MSNIYIPTAPTEDPEQSAQRSFFVAVCDCDESSFVQGFGCIHTFHVAPIELVTGGES